MDAAQVIRAISFPWAARAVRRHMGQLDGVQHIPLHGPFILAPNHSSYFDHFLTIILTGHIRGVPLWILTKQESFQHAPRRAWTDAWYGIPVDREQPGPSVIRAVSRVLAREEGVGIYPEGTRGPGDQLLPFKDGAFRFALKNDVPIVPVAIRGANRVLPPGSMRFRRETVDVAFGEPLLPDRTLSKGAQSADLAQRTRSAIESLLAYGLAAEVTGADVVDRLVSAHLDDESRLSVEWVKRLRHLTRLYLRSRPADLALRAQLVRLAGLEASHFGAPRRLIRAIRVRVAAEHVVRQNPDTAMAHYVLGRWHLSAPSVLGARPGKALRHFSAAARVLPSTDTRPAIGEADALERLGRSAEAARVYRQALDNLSTADPRSPRRAARLRDRLAQLEHQDA